MGDSQHCRVVHRSYFSIILEGKNENCNAKMVIATNHESYFLSISSCFLTLLGCVVFSRGWFVKHLASSGAGASDGEP